MWRRGNGADVRGGLRPDEQYRTGGVIHDEPGGLTKAFRAQPRPVPVPRHDEQVRIGRGCHHGPFRKIVNFQPFARTPEPARGRLEQLSRRRLPEYLEPVARILPARPSNPQ